MMREDRGWGGNGMFPLTPALSQRERGMIELFSKESRIQISKPFPFA